MFMKVDVIQEDGTVKKRIVDSTELKAGKVKHKKLPLELELRCQKLWKEVKDYDNAKNYKVFNRDFRRDDEPEREIEWWETFVEFFKEETKHIKTKDEKREAYRYLVMHFATGLMPDEFEALNGSTITDKVDLILNMNLN